MSKEISRHRLPAFLTVCLLAPVIAFIASHSTAEDAPEPARVLAIGGSVTEIIFALGEEDRLVARDTTSSYPPEAESLPDVGYMRALSPEGVLSVDPDLIVAEAGSGPPETLDVLRSADVRLVEVPGGFDASAVTAKIESVALALNVPGKGAALAARVQADLVEAMTRTEGRAPRRAMFVLSVQGGRILASGTGTAADGMLSLAGAVNAIDGFEGYKPLTDEAVIAARPDVIVMMDNGGDHEVANEALLALPAVAATPAGAAGRIVRMDGLLLLGFGPRTPEAVRSLTDALSGDIEG